MNRRLFLRLGGAALAAETARRYFDMGLAWQQHESGLLIPGDRDDTALIQGLIDDAIRRGWPATIQLDPREYFIKAPITLKPGIYTLQGDPHNRTTIVWAGPMKNTDAMFKGVVND